MAIFESTANILNQSSGDTKFRVTSVKTVLEDTEGMRAQRESTKWEEKKEKKEEFCGRKLTLLSLTHNTTEIQREKCGVLFFFKVRFIEV